MEFDVSNSTHDGVRIFEGDVPGVCCGTLVFGVGSSDEPPTLLGITHLLEHLLLRLIEPTTVELTAVVDAASLTVSASGSPDEVGRFFSTLAAGVTGFNAITECDLKLEKRVIRIENRARFERPNAGLLTYRYGLPGIGAESFGAPATISITRQEVVEWAARWLTAENATFAISSPRPPSLDLRLPRGDVAHREQRESLLATPALVASTKDGVALSLVSSRDDADSLLVALQQELFQDLRHRRGLIYNVEPFTTPVNAELTEVVMVLDPEREDIEAVVRTAAETVRRVVSDGFGETAVARARIQCAAEANRTFTPLEYLDSLATDALFGWPTRTPAEREAVAAELTAESLTAVLTASAPSLIIAYREDVKLKPRVLARVRIPVTRFTPWQELPSDSAPSDRFSATKWRRKRSKKFLVVTDEGIVQVGGRGAKIIRFTDLVLIGDRKCGCFCLVDFRGRSIEIDSDNWKHLKSLKAAVFDRAEPSLIRKFPAH